jgi:Skp family chaperone for outer membrane proteins
MKVLTTKILLVVFCVSLLEMALCSISLAQEEKPIKVAFVLMERVQQEYTFFQETTAKVNAEIGPKQEAIQNKLDEYTSQMDEIINELSNPMLTADAKKQLNDKYNSLMNDAFNYREQELNKLDQWSSDQYQPVYDKVYEEIQAMAQEGGYDLIINQSSSLLYGKQELDITTDLITRLNNKTGAGQ